MHGDPSDFRMSCSGTVASRLALNKVFKKLAKVLPVEFTTIGLLVFVHKDTLTMAQLCDGIAKN